MEAKRPRVYAELINTERQYINDMKMTVEVFLDPVRDRGLLSKEEIASLFSNLTALIPLNQDLLDKLENNVEVGTAFMEMIKHMKVYSIYCSSINNIKERIDGFSACYPKFRQLLEACARNPLCREMLLPDFLIMPLQRICKYPLLLKSLLECTPQEHADHGSLTTALAEMRQLIDMINNRTGIVENIRKLKKLEALIDNSKQLNLIKSNRAILRTGTCFLYKKQGKHKTELSLHLLSDLILISRMKDSKRELKEILATQESSVSKLAINKRSSRKLVFEEPKEVLTVLHKIELFTPPPSIDGSDFSGNLLELVEMEDVTETVACFVKMDKVVERLEFSSADDKRSWITDVTKAAKNCFEAWKKEYFKSLLDARMSRAITTPQPLPLSNVQSGLNSSHARSSSLGDIRVNAVVAAIEGKQNVSDIKVRKSPRNNNHSPVPSAWLSARAHTPRSINTEQSSLSLSQNLPETPPSPSSQTSPPTSPTSQHPLHKLPSYVSCPDLFNRPQSVLRTPSSEQNWEVESDETGLSDSRGSSGYESGGKSLASEDSWRGSRATSSRRLTIGNSSDLAFWEELRLANEKDTEKEPSDKLSAVAAPRGGSLVRSARRNFAMAVLTEHAISKMNDGQLMPNGNKGLSQSQTVSEVVSLHKHEMDKKEHEVTKKEEEISKRNEELAKKAEELKQKNEEIAKKDEEIEDLKKKLAEEGSRTRIFRDKFQEMQQLYHKAESREKQSHDAADKANLIAENEGLKKKVADERERRRFYRDKFQETQKLYQETLNSVVEFQEKLKILHNGKADLGGSGSPDSKKIDTQLAEERMRTKFFKEKFQEMNRLYQESLESVTTFVERSRTAEKMYRATLEDAQHSKRKTQELEGLFLETQESVAFFKEKIQAVEEACRESMQESEYFKLKAEKMEKLLIEAQKSVSLYEGNLDAMSGMLREAQDEALYYKQKALELQHGKEANGRPDTSATNTASQDLRELEKLYKEEQASARKCKELAEERVKKLEETVDKYKKMLSSPPPSSISSPRSSVLLRNPSKLMRNPSRISRASTTSAGMSKRREARKSRKTICMEELILDDAGNAVSSELAQTQDGADNTGVPQENATTEVDAQEGLDFPWLEFVRTNYHRLSSDNIRNYEKASDSSSNLSRSTTDSPSLAPQTSSQSLSHSSASDVYEDAEETDEFEKIEKSETPEPDARHSSRHRKSKQRAHKLQQQIHQKLQQKVKTEKFHQKEGDIG